MANHKSANKRNRQRLVRTVRNSAVKTRVRRVLKQAVLAVESNADDAADQAKAASRLLDRAASKNTIPTKRASRLKSRLALRVNKAAAAKE